MRLRCMRSQVVRKIDAFPAWFEGEFDSNEQVAWSGFQFRQLQLEKATLTTLRTNQQELVQQAEKVRSTLDRLALETQKLADAGNPSARIVVDELRKRGVTINQPAPQDAARK